jgi:hypothetical protein
MRKLYCYVDESGQDTKGRIFLVSVVITEKERNEISDFLIKIEKETGKHLLKWQKTDFDIRNDYLLRILRCNLLKHSIFFSKYESKAYVDLTILTVAKAIYQRAQGDYKATILVDGLNKKGTHKFASGLRKLKIRVRKVRGIKDQSDPLIRLADAMAGFLRDYKEKQNYAKKFFEQAVENQIIKEV